MGESQSARPQSFHRPQKSVSLPEPVKTIGVVYPSVRVTFPIPGYIRTVADLLTFINRKRPYEDPPVIGLRSEQGAELLDSLLNNPSQSTSILHSNDCLVTVHQVQFEDSELNETHFSLLKVIGRGSCATVYSAIHLPTGRLYALKVFNKRYLIKEDKVGNVFTERQVLLTCSSPFLLSLNWVFQSVSCI